MHDDFPLGPTGEFPDGRLGPDDQGELRVAIGHDKKKGQVFLEFNTPTRWLSMPPDAARRLAALFMNHANAIDGRGLTIAIVEGRTP